MGEAASLVASLVERGASICRSWLNKLNKAHSARCDLLEKAKYYLGKDRVDRGKRCARSPAVSSPTTKTPTTSAQSNVWKKARNKLTFSTPSSSCTDDLANKSMETSPLDINIQDERDNASNILAKSGYQWNKIYMPQTKNSVPIPYINKCIETLLSGNIDSCVHQIMEQIEIKRAVYRDTFLWL